MALTGKNNEEKIWNYLKAQGMTDCGAAGLMGNLYAESGLIPTTCKTVMRRSSATPTPPTRRRWIAELIPTL